MDKIIVVIPAYNEGKRIGGVIAGLPKSVSYRSRKYEVKVVVIDDGSKDNTFQQAKRANVVVLRHLVNCGAGAATRTGLRYALTEKDLAYVVTIDADGQHASEEITKIIRFAEKNKAAFVVGNRLHAANMKKIPLHRTIGNHGLSLISRLLFGIKVRDTQSGLRLIRGDAIAHVADYTIDRYGFCTEMLWRANRAKVPVCEMPIDISYSDETLNKGQNSWGVIELLLDLIWLRISE